MRDRASDPVVTVIPVQVRFRKPVVQHRFAQGHPYPDLDAVGEGREYLRELLRGQVTQEIGEGIWRDLDGKPGHGLARPR